MNDANTYFRKLHREILTEFRNGNIKTKMGLLSDQEKEKEKYLEGFEEGLNAFKNIILGEIYLGNLEVDVKTRG